MHFTPSHSAPVPGNVPTLSCRQCHPMQCKHHGHNSQVQAKIRFQKHRHQFFFNLDTFIPCLCQLAFAPSRRKPHFSIQRYIILIYRHHLRSARSKFPNSYKTFHAVKRTKYCIETSPNSCSITINPRLAWQLKHSSPNPNVGTVTAKVFVDRKWRKTAITLKDISRFSPPQISIPAS